MRFASLVLAFAFLFAGPSIVGPVDNRLPHIGSFAFNGASTVAAPSTLVVASMR